VAQKASFALGTELGVQRLLAPPANYFDTLRSNFNLGVIDGGVYWRSMEREPGVPDYSLVDRQLNVLQQQGLVELQPLRGHPLYYPATNPTWLLEGEYKARELVALLRKRISRLVGRYRGVIKEWVVVNEPYYPGASSRQAKDILYSKVGKRYIEIAFEAAREADPSAVLIFNDTNNHVLGLPGTANTLKTVGRLRSRGLIDGVGLQMHLKAVSPPTISQLMKAMREYPVPVYITELDVDLSGVHGSREERFFAQAKIYSDVLLAALETGVCNSLTLWGIGDQFSWLEVFQGRPQADGTIFDDDFNPKPAYFALFELLERRAKDG
jgi:endo-1,4-beta-xylanase